MPGVDLLTVSRMNGVNYGTIRYWASRYNWPQVGWYQGRAQYDYNAVADAVADWQQGKPQRDRSPLTEAAA